MIPLSSYNGHIRQEEVRAFRKATKALGMQTTLAELISRCNEIIDASPHKDTKYIETLRGNLRLTYDTYLLRNTL